MDINQSLNLYITHVEPEGPFLKLWGQTDKATSMLVEEVLNSLTQHLESGLHNLAPENVQNGKLVCAKYKDNKYYRARIVNVTSNGYVDVNFFDFGNRDILPYHSLRHLQAFPPSFISIPPLAHSFIFAEAHTVGEWNPIVFQQLAKELKYREVQCTCVGHGAGLPLVKLFYAGTDLSSVLNGLIQCISVQGQQAVLLSMSMNKGIPIMPPPGASSTPSPTVGTEINTYKAVTLEPGREYSVYVSFVNDGPCHFSVQLDSSLDCLGKLMRDINTVPLKMLDDIPIPGTICLAKCEDDGNICRAVVTNEVDNQFKVFYVDFGNYEVVPSTSLFQIPFKYVLPKVMAIRLALAGVEKSTVTLEMQCAFKKFVDDRLLHIKVLPAPTRLAVPKCELWDPSSGTSALDVVNSAARNAYPEPMSLNRGFSQPVKVSFVYSCNRFYVQLCSKEDELLRMMLELQNSCASSESMDPSTLTVGLPCCALYEGDQKWYRSQIVEILPQNLVKVRYIDYGNEEVVSNTVLRLVEGEQLTVLRPQAIECCLNGYQNMSVDEERDNFLEELILESQFTMKVVDMLGSKALIELIDAANYNVASLLLDKIASAKSQVSPMLVQANNRIEHRKNATPPNNRDFRQERKPGRDNKQYNDRQNDGPWRQDEQNNRQNDRFTNERSPDQGSWRQNNKGFNNRDGDENRAIDNRFNNRGGGGGDRRDTNRNPSDSWDANNTADWSTPKSDSGYRGGKEHGDNRNRNFSPKEHGDWNNQKSDFNRGDRGGYKKKEFKKDGSELSSSGSERSFHKGPRTSSRNDKFPKKFDDKPKNLSFGNDSWNVSAVTIDLAPIDAKFTDIAVVGITAKVSISWFHNPAHFYCQLKDNQDSFKTLMEDIQIAYKDRKPESVKRGAPIIGLFPEDSVLYRGQVLEVLSGGSYKVLYVDFGNVSVINKVWPIEKKFMTLPAQAVCCQLSDVSPVDGAWAEPDNYEQYFGKDEFDCCFISEHEKIFQVLLSSDATDIGQQLIQDGHAVSLSQAIPAADLSILLSQQFRCVLKNVNSLSDVVISLYSGFPISCKAHNLETATEIFEDALKAYVEKPLIVYVDNVLENILEVTFYDNEGNKICILTPDEGAFDNIEPLCPYMIASPAIFGFVSHVEENSIFVQPQEVAETVAYLLEKLYEVYNASAQDSPIVPEEGFVYAVLSGDENWYRGKVISFDDEKAVVNFIDYGNNESVPFKSLRSLDAQFNEISICALQIAVSVPTENLAEKDVTANVFYGLNGWEGEIIVQDAIELQPNQLLFEPEPQVAAPPAEEPPVSEVIPEEPTDLESEIAPTPNLNSSLGISVVVSHVDSPSDFYIQLSEALDDIEVLQTQLQELVSEMDVLENPTAGVMCAAPYSVDQQWYRAQVLDADEDITTVRFVDYGNTDVIDNKNTEIKTLPPNMLSAAVYATRCSLKLKPVEEEWSTEAHDKFVSICEGEITAEFLNQDEKTNYVELYLKADNNKKITDLLTEDRLALSYEFVEESKVTCFVSHINSPSEFWIQLENCADELENIAEQLSNAHEFPELEILTPGTLCVALFNDDNMWYRARILSNTVAGIELLFLDYGNSSISENLRQIPEELVVTSPLAQKCSLQKPENLPEWTAEHTEKLNEIAADGQTIFTIKKITTGETSVVEMFADNANILETLIPVTEEGYLKSYENANSFEIEKNGEVLKQKFRLESDGASWSDECEEYFKSIAEKGEPLQILFLPENTVRVYLNGKNLVKTAPKSEKKVKSNLSFEEEIKDEAQSIFEEIVENATATEETNQEEKVPDENNVSNNEEKSENTVEEMSNVVSELVDSIEDISASKNVEEITNVVNEIVDNSCENINQEMSEVVDEIVDNSCKNINQEKPEIVNEIFDKSSLENINQETSEIVDNSCENINQEKPEVVNEIVNKSSEENINQEMSKVVNEIVDNSCENINKEMSDVVNGIVDSIGDVCDKDKSEKGSITSENSKSSATET